MDKTNFLKTIQYFVNENMFSEVENIFLEKKDQKTIKRKIMGQVSTSKIKDLHYSYLNDTEPIDGVYILF
jgi:hypothetical protein